MKAIDVRQYLTPRVDLGGRGEHSERGTAHIQPEADMHAKPGDMLIVESQTVDRQQRQATILEVRSADGSPPYLVRWQDGHEGLVYPGPDAHITAAQQQ
jgi:hypothetical protein